MVAVGGTAIEPYVERARPDVAGLALGVVLAPLFGLASLVRGERCVHPDGVAAEGVLVVADPPSRVGYGSILGVPGEHRAVVRLSRGLGYAPPRRDVHGLAIRLPDAGGPGRAQDLLLVTVTPKAGGRFKIVESAGFGPLLATVLAQRVGTTLTRLTAVPVGGVADDAAVLAGATDGLAFRLAGHLDAQVSVPLAELRVGPSLEPATAEDLRFDPWNTGGGISPAGVLGGARRVVYPASQLGRRLRRA